MAKSKSAVPFTGTPEQEARLREYIVENRDRPGSLMPILQEAQSIYGYLPEEVQRIIADDTGTSLSEVYGVVTFYSQFNLTPRGEYTVSVCLGTACYVKGAGGILDKIRRSLGLSDGEECTPDMKFSVIATRCMGACALAPVLTVNEDVYGRLVLDDIDGIIEKYTG